MAQSHRARRTRRAWSVLTADPAFEQLVRSTFGASGADRAARRRRHARAAAANARRRRRHRRRHRSRRQPRRGDRGAAAADAPHRRLAAGGRGDAELRRRRGAAAAADAGRRFPGQAGAAGRAGAHLRARRAGADRSGDATEAQIYTFLPAVGGAGVTTLAIQTALLLLNSGQRGRAIDLPGRSRFPARRLRRLSRPRAAPRPQGNRAAPGAARPPAARSDAVASLRPAWR